MSGPRCMVLQLGLPSVVVPQRLWFVHQRSEVRIPVIRVVSSGGCGPIRSLAPLGECWSLTCMSRVTPSGVDQDHVVRRAAVGAGQFGGVGVEGGAVVELCDGAHGRIVAADLVVRVSGVDGQGESAGDTGNRDGGTDGRPGLGCRGGVTAAADGRQGVQHGSPRLGHDERAGVAEHVPEPVGECVGGGRHGVTRRSLDGTRVPSVAGGEAGGPAARSQQGHACGQSCRDRGGDRHRHQPLGPAAFSASGRSVRHRGGGVTAPCQFVEGVSEGTQIARLVS